MIQHSKLFGECPNNEWDHYVDFEEITDKSSMSWFRKLMNIFK